MSLDLRHVYHNFVNWTKIFVFFSLFNFVLGVFNPDKQIVAILLQIIEFPTKKGVEATKLNYPISILLWAPPPPPDSTANSSGDNFVAPLCAIFCLFVVQSCICKLGTCALVCLLTAMRPLQTFLRNFNTINNQPSTSQPTQSTSSQSSQSSQSSKSQPYQYMVWSLFFGHRYADLADNWSIPPDSSRS